MPNTFFEVDLEAIKKNFRAIKKIAGDTEIMAIVKADAYGHGAVSVSKALLEEGARSFGVANIDEALELYESGIRQKFFILSGIFPGEEKKASQKNFIPVIHNLQSAKALSKTGRKIEVHIKIDTGMGRLGFRPEESEKAIFEISALDNLEITGVCSHFADSENNMDFSMKQLKKFLTIKEKTEKILKKKIHPHIANSAAILNIPESRLDMVRPGIAIYGHSPNDGFQSKFKQAGRLKSTVGSLKKVKKGETISYGMTFKAKRDSLIASIPIGYGDGFSRIFSNNGFVLIDGKRLPVVGRVCMDWIMVDATDIKNIKLGDEVVLFGTQKQKSISFKEAAETANTIPYEIMCQIGKRVKRVYR